MKTLNIKTSIKTLMVTSLIASGVSSFGDDTEVFYSVNVSKPNLLFVLDNSGSMNWDLNGNSPSSSSFQAPSRLTVLQNSVQTVLNATKSRNFNVGVMRYGPGMNNNEWNTTNENARTHGVSGVAFPLTDSKSKASDVIATAAEQYNLPTFPNANRKVRQYISDIVNNWTASGGTPITGALYEAALYFRGEQMHYGLDQPNGIVAAHPSTYDGPVITSDITTTNRNLASAPNYKRPINSSCQKNYMVLMSDGSPTYYYNDNIDGQNVPWSESRGPFAQFMQGNPGYSNLAANVPTCSVDAPNGFTAGKCGPDLTKYLAENDNVPDPSDTNPNGLEGIQDIKTYTIGFGVASGSATEGYLQSLETIEDDPETKNVVEDGYFSANNQAELVAAFKKIIDQASEPDGTLASPGYSVNVKSGLEHEKDIYIPVFDRKNTSRWSGNLKKFKLVDVNGKRKIRGQNNLDAVDELGGFIPSAFDMWSESATADGPDVEKGGLASLIDNPQEGAGGRKLFSNLTNNKRLSTSGNLITEDNFANLPDSVLGITNGSDDADYRKTLANFMRGYEDGDKTKGPRRYMGDMLHSEPLVITYNSGDSNGNGKQQYIFAGTNEGYLHAFDTITGEEKFAFMPKELLKNVDALYLNAGTEKDHKYGIDGTLTYWLKENGTPNGKKDGTDEVYLYFGLRRGGHSFYALNVTDINDPYLEWIVSDDTYPSMGQSWSAPYLAKVGVGSNSTPTEVMIISGGYDDAEDRDLRTFCSDEHGVCTLPAGTVATVWYGANNTWVSKSNVSGSINCSNSVFGDPLVGVFKSCKYEVNGGGYDATANVPFNKNTKQGNDIFIFNAHTGDYIWSLKNSNIGNNTIKSSIPGGVRILDTTYNGLVDRMYFADTGGKVWRLDLSEKLTPSGDSESKLYEFASLGVGNTRKFYNEPDVAVMKLKGKTLFTVSIGSGFRAHPMDKTIDDRFFVLLDKSPFAPMPQTDADGNSISPIQPINADLAKITISDTSVSQWSSIKNKKRRGWQVILPKDGEKVLATAVTFDGIVTFTTLVPEVLLDDGNGGIDLCKAPPTHGKFYAINIFTGEAGLDLNEDGVITDADISMMVAKGEIPGKPQAIVNSLNVEDITDDEGNATGKKSCTHPVDIRIGKKLSQATGYDTCRLESVYWSDPAIEE